MPPKRTRAQGTGETSNTEIIAQGSKNPTLTAAQIAELVATTVAQILANRPESRPQPDQQSEEIRKLQEEIESLKRERSSTPPPPPAREVHFSAEVLAAPTHQIFECGRV
ncbi:receptor-like protein kinase FERONIA-like [Dorcoceras hygrometricum]|uniref:Receptor-like protein kinase FERONIA-like n=1 Tax=Dorcoceras hygrometricum TaxID=472368 RepID=A0A2Z7AFC9_9LAMI|nr:receptor-like protein kinase FERONIA-like [Dorcoceras hygrometricum]